jgi:hypothetical protein
MLFHRGYDLPERWVLKKGDRAFLGPQFAVVGLAVREMAFSQPESAPIDSESNGTIGVMLGGHPTPGQITFVDHLLDGMYKGSPLSLLVAGSGRPIERAIDLWLGMGHEVRQASAELPWLDVRACELAVTNGGQSLVESMTLGIPALAVTADADQWLFARSCERLGLCVAVDGREDRLPQAAVAKVRQLSQDRSQRPNRERPAKRVFDGGGAKRIAARIMESTASHGLSH